MSMTFCESGSDATQDLSAWTSTTGTVASDSGQSRTGPRSIKLSTGSPAVSAGVIKTLVLADTGRRVSFAFRFDTLPAANAAILALTSSIGVLVCPVVLLTTGVLAVAPTGATAAIGTTALSINTWYVLTICYTITNTTTFRFDLYIDGALEVSATAGTLTNTGTSRIIFQCTNVNGANHNMWIDDVYIDDVADYSYPGPVRVKAERALSNGTLNDFPTQIGAGSSGYGSGHAPQVNEQPLSQTNGWSKVGAGVATTEEYNVEGPAIGDVDVARAVQLGYAGWIYASSLAPSTGQLIVNGVSTAVSLTSTATYFAAYTSAANPVNGSGADVGLTTDTTLTTVSLYECGILIAYVPAATAPKGVFHPCINPMAWF